MNLANPFPLSVRVLFMDCWECWKCGSNGQGRNGLELHHIFGRISGSAFNAAPLCGVCHARVGHTYEEHRRLFRRTLGFLTLAYERGIFALIASDTAFKASVEGDLKGLDLSPFW